MTRVTQLCLPLFIGLASTGCPQRTAVWVREGSTASNLVLQFGTDRRKLGGADIGVIRVYECGGSSTGLGAMWVVGPQGGTAELRELTYGLTPPGFTSDQGPQPLEPKCYRVDVSGTGKTEFVVDSAGRVSERPLDK